MVQCSIAQSLPHELLEVVLRAVVEEDRDKAHLAYNAHRASKWNPEREERFGAEWLEKKFLESSTALLPCLLVCKQWYPTASKLLYHAVDLTPKTTEGDQGEDENEDEGNADSEESSAVKKAESFYETVSTRPALAALVMSLKIGGQPILGHPSLDSHALATHSFLCTAILKRCTRIESLFVSQIAAGHKNRLLTNVQLLKRLRVLDVGSHCSSKPGVAVFDFSDCQKLSTGPALQIIGFNWMHLTRLHRSSLIASPTIRRLDLHMVAMTDVQFVATMACVGPTLESLFIGQEISGGFDGRQPWSVTYAGLQAGLSHLKALEHLHLDISQDYAQTDLSATSATLLAPLCKLRTVYVTPDTFPYTGLGHLASPHLEKFRLFIFSGLSYPPIDEVALVAGIEAMIRTPATCPSAIKIGHQIAVMEEQYDEDGEIEWEADFPAPQALEAEIVDHLTARCAAAGVLFVYTPRFI